MGHQLRKAGVHVVVVMFDLEVTWPPPATNSRVGGYDFLGGETEAILLLCRAFGKFEFAVKEAVELTALQAKGGSIDVDALKNRAYAALNQRGLSFDLFSSLVKRGGANIQQIHTISTPWQPPEKYEGPALLVLAPDSAEFASAQEINAQYCTKMEVVHGKGSHYNMMQAEQAVVQARLVLEFLKRLGCPVEMTISVRTDQLLLLRPGKPQAPKIYMVHGLDGDAMGGGGTFKSIAAELSNCRVGALVYDSEALACNSLPELAVCYNQRVRADAESHGPVTAENPIVVAGYSWGCVLAHQMGHQLRKAGVHVVVVMFDLEVTWPPPATNSRVGGYDFLGGETEAILLICRAFGKFEFAVQEAVELTELKAKGGSIDVDALKDRAYAALNQRGLSFELFSTIVKRGGANIQQIHTISTPWQPPEKYEGPALLVLAPDSAEFASAEEINAQYCTKMEVVHGKGSHYNMMQAEQAVVQARLVLEFLKRLGCPVEMTISVRTDQLLLLRPGKPQVPKIYMVHGLDGDAMGGGGTFKSIAAELSNCRVGALVYDSEALACNSLPELAVCYNQRVRADAESHGPVTAENPIVVAGYSWGCVLAHQMGHQLRKAGVHVVVVMFDLEVTWPPPATNSRVGGYDFLGGETEAILLICRAFGKFEFAVQEAVELTELKAKGGSIDVDALKDRAYAALNQRGLSFELFSTIVKRGGANIQQIHTISTPWQPAEKYEGPALLVLAPDSAEFASAEEINAQYCTRMEVVHGKGSHYNMMQAEQAVVQARLVLEFLKRLGCPVEMTISVRTDQLLLLRPGKPQAPKIYMVHGLDGDAMGGGGTFKSIAAEFSNCRVGALVYDSEALACNSLPRGGANIQQIHTISTPWQPPEKYEGPALLVLAPDSAEFASAQEINAQYCTKMEVVHGKGSHYNMMQAEQAVVQARLVLEFLKRLGCPVEITISVRTDQLLLLRPGKPQAPKIYMVHGLDGDAMGGGGTFKSIAAEFSNCRVGALVYDSEALACNSLPELAACYNQRVRADAESHGPVTAESPIVVCGYSWGCVLAHQMGHQLRKAGVHVHMVMFDLEVTWPPPATTSRVGGYDFLGGETEAILLISRAFGKFEFAVKEAVELTELQAKGGSWDVAALKERAFAALKQRGLSSELFSTIVERGGANIQQIHTISTPWQPPEKYEGPALLVLAPDSSEFASAAEINAQYCTKMEVVHGKGSHYNMMQAEQAVVQAQLVLEFLKRLGCAVEIAGLGRSDQLVILRPGKPEARKIYMVHGLDGDCMGGGTTFKGIAEELSNCRVGALVYDSEAMACNSLPELAACYNKRVVADAEGFGPITAEHPVIVAGYSWGCVPAHEMGHQLQQAGVHVAVVMFDMEVCWPPPREISRLGGYEFLGGEVEAILLICRTCAQSDFATKEVKELTALKASGGSVDVDRLKERAWAALEPTGLPFELFTTLVKRSGANIEKLHFISSPWQPPEKYEGPALLVRADSPEFASAEEINAQHCTRLEVVRGQGSHYGMLQAEHAVVQAQLVLEFLKRLEEEAELAKRVPTVEGVRILGHSAGPGIYFLHGLDGGSLAGQDLGELPFLLPGHVCTLEYDDMAFACESVESLAELYRARILKDMKLQKREELVLVGRSVGAPLACLLALQLQQGGVPSSLVILDSEVVWPSKLDAFCYDWLPEEVEATLWLANLAGAKDFVQFQVERAIAAGFPEGAARLQTASYGECAGKLQALGIFSLKAFRCVCSLASSNAHRLRQLMRPKNGSLWHPPGVFQGKALIVTGSERLERMQMAGSYLANLTVRVSQINEPYTVDSGEDIVRHVSELLFGAQAPAPGLLALDNAVSAVPAAPAPSEKTAVYLIPGCDGDMFGHLALVAETVKCATCRLLDFDDEALKQTTLMDLAAVFVKRILRDQEESHSRFSKVALVGHFSGANVAFEIALHLQDTFKVFLVILQGEVNSLVPPERCCEAWLGSTCEAVLWMAAGLGYESFAQKEANAFRAKQVNISPGLLQAVFANSAEGLSTEYITANCQYMERPKEVALDELLMKTFWKLSDELNGYSVNSFKDLVHDLAARMEWFMRLAATSPCKDSFDGPSLLVLSSDTPSEERENLLSSNDLYCSKMNVYEAEGGRFDMSSQSARIAAFIDSL
ncbi:unnamed protein product [Effrenium voratum]|nr:unnamed protein product [Effrenium voratum]